MRRNHSRMKGAALLMAGMTVYGTAGGCLPPNYFADLASQAVTSTVLQVLATVVDNVIADDVAAAKAEPGQF
jgi:hypothetical protein